MVKLLFWNIARQPIPDLIAEAAYEHDVDLLLIAEMDMPLSDLLLALNTRGAVKYSAPLNPARRVTILTSLPVQSVELVSDLAHASIRRIRPPLGPDFLLAVVHLPSKLHLNDTDQLFLATRLAREITKAEARVGHSRTIAMGDFNMNPFEAGLVGSDGFHGVMHRRIAERGGRTVHGKYRPFFYNPMWNFLGDESPGPPGTYHYSAGKPLTYFWNIFDQVLIRPSLLGRVHEGGYEVLTSIGATSLLSNSGLPSKAVASDHLPILCTISLDESDEQQQ